MATRRSAADEGSVASHRRPGRAQLVADDAGPGQDRVLLSRSPG